MTQAAEGADYGALLEQQQKEWEAARVYLTGRGIPAHDYSYNQCVEAMKNLQNGSLYLRRLDSYRTRSVEWLRKPFFQGSAFHLLAGKKGQCKGTFLAGLAARVTTAKMYPDPKIVLMITSEDSVELDFRPRFLAADGNPALLHVVNGDFRLPRDVDWLRQTALGLGDIGLIAIDPLGNHLERTGTDGEGDVRYAIAPLNGLADELGCMVFGVRHVGKDRTQGALSAVLGSTAWVDVPRCVIVMAQDDEDEMEFHAQVVAGNRGPKSAAMQFRLHIVDVDDGDDRAVDVTLLDGIGPSEKDVNDLLAAAPPSKDSKSKSAAARELVLDILDEEGTVGSDELDARVAAACGLSVRTVQNIRVELKDAGLIRTFPDKDEFGAVERWNVKRTLASRDVGKQATSRPRLPGDLGMAA